MASGKNRFRRPYRPKSDPTLAGCWPKWGRGSSPTLGSHFSATFGPESANLGRFQPKLDHTGQSCGPSWRVRPSRARFGHDFARNRRRFGEFGPSWSKLGKTTTRKEGSTRNPRKSREAPDVSTVLRLIDVAEEVLATFSGTRQVIRMVLSFHFRRPSRCAI